MNPTNPKAPAASKVEQENKELINNQKDQKELFASSSLEALREIASFMGLKDSQIPADATKEELVALLEGLKRNEIQVAKTVKHDGKEYVCPVGSMVIRVTPKSGGEEYGAKTKEAFFFAVQGECIVGRRGEVVVLPDKYESAWKDAVKTEYDDGEPGILEDGRTPKRRERREVPAEDVTIYVHNPDHAARKWQEEQLIENSKKNLLEKTAAKNLGLADLLRQAGRHN